MVCLRANEDDGVLDGLPVDSTVVEVGCEAAVCAADVSERSWHGAIEREDAIGVALPY